MPNVKYVEFTFIYVVVTLFVEIKKKTAYCRLKTFMSLAKFIIT
jgi:hypothetical protein